MKYVIDFWHKIQKTVLTVLFAIALSSIMILVFTDENPINAYLALLKGSLVGKLNIGTTLTQFTTLLLTSLAFAIAFQGGFFNTGIEGDLFMGSLAATLIGILGSSWPKPILLIATLVGAVTAGMLWSLIPATLNVYLNVNVICACYMLNMAAMYICQYFVLGPFAAPVANPQSLDVGVRIPQILLPSKLTIGIFFAIALLIYFIWALKNSTFGFKLKTMGGNPKHARFAGINPNVIGIKAMLISGALAGFAGFIEIIGNYGYFQNNYALGLGGDGLLAAMIVKCNPKLLPLSAFFVSMLSSGSLYMQQTTGVPKFIADTIAGIFIVIATMETLFKYKEKKKPAAQKVVKEG